MANQEFEDIKDNFQTKLETLVTPTGVVTEVIFGRGQSEAGFPYLRFFINNIDTVHIAQFDYRRGIGFQIDIVQEISQKSEEQGEIDLGNAMWALFNLLEDEWDLDANVMDDSAGNTSEVTAGDGKVIVASIIAKPRTFTSFPT